MQNLIESFLEELGYMLDETDLTIMFDSLSKEEQIEVKKALMEYLEKYLPVKEK